MIKSIEEMDTKIEINLLGPEGNVFNLLSVGGRLCKQLGLNSEIFTRRMMSRDYEYAVATFEEYFGNFVTLYR
jgi:hypothetical protein